MAKTPQGRRVVSPAGLQPFPRGSWPYPLAWSVCTAIAGVQGGKGLHVTLGCVMGRVAFRVSHLYCPLLQVWWIFLPGASLSFPSLCLPLPLSSSPSGSYCLAPNQVDAATIGSIALARDQ